MPSIRFTVKALNSLETARDRDDFYDESFPSFGVRVSRGGGKHFFYRYREGGKYRRIALGRFPAVSLGEARGKAFDYHGQVARGETPGESVEDWRRAPTVATVLEEYIEKYVRRYHRRADANERVLRRLVLPAFGDRRVVDLRRREISSFLSDLVEGGAPQMANRTLSLFRHLLTWCVQEEVIESNPCLGLRPPAPEKRGERVLNASEIRQAWKGLGEMGSPAGVIGQLMLLTGQRSMEVRNLCWDQVDGDLWTIPIRFHKGKREHVVPLVLRARELVEAQRGLHPDLVLPSRVARKPMSLGAFDNKIAGMVQELGMASWRPHDLRRTAATNLGSLGYSNFWIGKVLGHSDGSMAAIYNKWDYLPEKRAMLEAWEKRLEAILAEEVPVAGSALTEDAGAEA